MVSPWTTVIVHMFSAIKDILFVMGLAGAFVFMISLGACADGNYGNMTKKMLQCSALVIALAVTAHVMIPPTAALARILIVQQLPADADIEVIDELVYRTCKEAR